MRFGTCKKQRKNKVCLARFLLPLHKGFYIIDEPFTNIDAISEEQCIKAISCYLDCSGILISHKLNMIRTLSDGILILEDGKITERGTHSNLIEKSGLYARLYGTFTEFK
jgi:ABC-type multidrug transport system fused ATPase/permease subunit